MLAIALIELLTWLYENVLDVFILSLNVREKNTQKRENNNIAHMSLWYYHKGMDLKYLYLKMLMQDLIQYEYFDHIPMRSNELLTYYYFKWQLNQAL